jgi:hypothetical protein
LFSQKNTTTFASDGQPLDTKFLVAMMTAFSEGEGRCWDAPAQQAHAFLCNTNQTPGELKLEIEKRSRTYGMHSVKRTDKKFYTSW